jgi:hypothetical protein
VRALTHRYSAFLCYEIAEISTMTRSHSIDHQAAFMETWIKNGNGFLTTKCKTAANQPKTKLQNDF